MEWIQPTTPQQGELQNRSSLSLHQAGRFGVGAEIGPMIEPNETTWSCHFVDSPFMLHIDYDYDYNIHIISNLVI